MGEVAKRAADIITSTVSNTVSPAVTALMATAAVVTRSPELGVFSVPAGAFAGAVTEQGLLLVNQTLRDRANRVQRFADVVADETGQPIDDFVAEHVIDSSRRELLGHIVDAATTARSEWKIRILARAFVRGAKDGDLVDETVMYVDLLRNLDLGHARYIAAVSAISAEGREVKDQAVLEFDPGIAAAAPLLRQRLVELGIVVDPVMTAAPQLTQLGVACARWLANLEASP